MNAEVSDRKNQRTGLIISILLHILLLLAFYFLVVWKQQIPPPEPIGMSINFGSSESGFGDVQPERENSQQDEVVPEQAEQQVPQETSQPVPDPTPVVNNSTPAVTEALQKEGPVKVEEKKSPPTEQNETKPVESKPQENTTEKKEETKLNQSTLFTGPKSNTTNTSTNQGTKEGTTGDQGSTEGNLNSKTQYGGPGTGGGGFTASVTGWGTDFKLPENKPEATGVLEFKIKIDSNGDVVGITISKMIGNPEAEKFYKDIITREMKFYRISGGQIPPYSEGTITLNLKVK